MSKFQIIVHKSRFRGKILFYIFAVVTRCVQMNTQKGTKRQYGYK